MENVTLKLPDDIIWITKQGTHIEEIQTGKWGLDEY